SSYCCDPHRSLHTFPTRRSSDLMTALEEEPTIEAYADNLKSIRYRDKVILGYHSRLHYTIDWIYENSKNGIMKDITSEIGGVKEDRKSTRLNSSHVKISYAVFCL